MDPDVQIPRGTQGFGTPSIRKRRFRMIIGVTIILAVILFLIYVILVSVDNFILDDCICPDVIHWDNANFLRTTVRSLG